jgi:hypothetical protein
MCHSVSRLFARLCRCAYALTDESCYVMSYIVMVHYSQNQGARRFLSGSAGTGTGTVSGCRNCRNLPELPVLGGCNRRFSLLATH